MTNINIDCNNCINISLKEHEQINKTEIHKCLEYNERCYHRAFTKIHKPKIYPCKSCQEDDYKKYIKGGLQ